MTSAAQLARAALGDVAGTQSREAAQNIVVRLVITISGHVAYPFVNAAAAGVSRTSPRVLRVRATSAGAAPRDSSRTPPPRRWASSPRDRRAGRPLGIAVKVSTAHVRRAARVHRPPPSRTARATAPETATTSVLGQTILPGARHGGGSSSRLRATVKSHGPRRVSGSSLVAWRTSRSHVSSSRSSASVRFRVIRSRKANTLGRYRSVHLVERAGVAGAEPRHEHLLVVGSHRCHNPPGGQT